MSPGDLNTPPKENDGGLRRTGKMVLINKTQASPPQSR